MVVDVLELSAGRYLVRLASGETAWIAAGLVTLALLAADEEQSCRNDSSAGVIVRTSGEVVPFDRCEAGSDIIIVWKGEDAA
ncbi:MAG: hypothetical protein JWL76_2470, partial [Thermoleophilia bacterium]|nr:hypothetical protein [Thermoleophilia bacterium]